MVPKCVYYKRRCEQTGLDRGRPQEQEINTLIFWYDFCQETDLSLKLEEGKEDKIRPFAPDLLLQNAANTGFVVFITNLRNTKVNQTFRARMSWVGQRKYALA